MGIPLHIVSVMMERLSFLVKSCPWKILRRFSCDFRSKTSIRPSTLVPTGWNEVFRCNRRTVYTNSYLQIDSFQREIKAFHIYPNTKTLRRKMMSDPVREVSNFMPILSTLKNNADDNKFLMEYLVALSSAIIEKTPALCPQLAAIGKSLMQYFHVNRMDNVAIRFFGKDRLKILFFVHLNSQIFLDLLYKTKRYDEAISFYREMRSNHLKPSKYVLHLLVASCFKKHTEEAFETALEAAQNGQNELFANTLNILTLFALQKDKQMPDISMSACASGVSEQARTNLLILSLAKRNKFESIFPLIQQRTLHDKYFARNMIDIVSSLVFEHGSDQTINEFQQTKHQLESAGCVTDEPLEHIAFKFNSTQLSISEAARMDVEYRSFTRKLKKQ